MALLAAGNAVPDVKPGGKIPAILLGKSLETNVFLWNSQKYNTDG
jgi:hypothetical protein